MPDKPLSLENTKKHLYTISIHQKMNDTGGMVPSKGNRGFEAPTSKEGTSHSSAAQHLINDSLIQFSLHTWSSGALSHFSRALSKSALNFQSASRGLREHNDFCALALPLSANCLKPNIREDVSITACRSQNRRRPGSAVQLSEQWRQWQEETWTWSIANWFSVLDC